MKEECLTNFILEGGNGLKNWPGEYFNVYDIFTPEKHSLLYAFQTLQVQRMLFRCK